jgi:hypothetical protein
MQGLRDLYFSNHLKAVVLQELQNVSVDLRCLLLSGDKGRKELATCALQSEIQASQLTCCKGSSAKREMRCKAVSKSLRARFE